MSKERIVFMADPQDENCSGGPGRSGPGTFGCRSARCGTGSRHDRCRRHLPLPTSGSLPLPGPGGGASRFALQAIPGVASLLSWPEPGRLVGVIVRPVGCLPGRDSEDGRCGRTPQRPNT